MYRVELYARVRRACHVEGMSIREAARVFGVDRRTVAKMLVYAVPPGYRRSKPRACPKLDPYIGVIDRILEEDRERHSKQRHTAKRIFDRLREEYGFGILEVDDIDADWFINYDEIFYILEGNFRVIIDDEVFEPIDAQKPCRDPENPSAPMCHPTSPQSTASPDDRPPTRDPRISIDRAPRTALPNPPWFPPLRCYEADGGRFAVSLSCVLHIGHKREDVEMDQARASGLPENALFGALELSKDSWLLA